MNVSCYKCRKLFNMILEKCPYCNVARDIYVETGIDIAKAVLEFGETMYLKGQESMVEK